MMKGIKWNKNAAYKAAFICSNMTSERLNYMACVRQVIPVDGYGRAFNSKIANHSESGFLKRDLLSDYKYCFCPENSIADGYFTEKIPESYIGGSIPITFCSPNMSVDFSPESVINIYQFFGESGFKLDEFINHFHNPEVNEKLLNTALVTRNMNHYAEQMLFFVSDFASIALS